MERMQKSKAKAILSNESLNFQKVENEEYKWTIFMILSLLELELQGSHYVRN